VAEVFKVGMAEFKVAQVPNRIACFGIGSCVCVALYDPEAKVAGLAHSMLPSAPAMTLTSPEDRPKYADTAVPHLIDVMERLGAKRSRIYARLVGGATMFSFGSKSDGSESLGERNLRSARESLKSQGITLKSEEGGGGVGRSLEFDPGDGSLLVRTARAELRWL
jgi:chemotaxis protein CheD